MAVEQISKPQWKFTCDFCPTTALADTRNADGWEIFQSDNKNERWTVHLCPACCGVIALTAIRAKQAQLFRQLADKYNT